MKPAPRSLRRYLLISFAFVSLMPHILLGVVGIATISLVEYEAGNEKNRLLARSFAGQVQSFLEEKTSGLAQAASLIDKGLIPEKDYIAYFKGLLETYPFFEAVIVLDKRGTVKTISPFDRDYLGMDLTRQVYYVREPSGPVWSNTFLSMQSGNSVVGLSLPLASGQIIGIFNLEFLSDLAERLSPGRKGDAIVLDAQATFIVDRDRSIVRERVRFPEPDFLENLSTIDPKLGYYFFRKNEYLSAALRLPQTGWSILISQMRSEVDISSRTATIGFLLSMMVSASVALIISLRARGRILEPLSRLTAAADGISDGHYLFDNPFKSGIVETDRLATTFYTMSATISTRENGMRQSEECLKNSLAEKEILLKEIHHRVKNNLQIISSIMNLQAMGFDDEHDALPFIECQNRVQTMAAVHEQLYLSPDISRINAREYFETIGNNILAAHSGSSDRISLVVDSANMTLDVDSAMPCGLIVTEAISNSCKHAFPGDRNGSITVVFREFPDGSKTLRIHDDGVGPGENFIKHQEQSLGLQVVEALSQQLKGSLKVGAADGGGFEIFIEYS